MNYLLFIFLAFSGTLSAVANNEIDFQNDFYKARKLAKKSNKVMFVNFTAKWCGACKMMEHQTYKNERLIRVIYEQAIAVKLDVDSFDGIELKMKYDVMLLPTIIFFYPDGTIAGKYERRLGPSEMERLITEFNQDIKSGKKIFNKPKNFTDFSNTPSESEKEQFIGQSYKIVFMQTRDYSLAASRYYKFQELLDVPLNLFVNEDNQMYSVVTGDFPDRASAKEASEAYKKHDIHTFVSAISDL